MAKFFRRGKSKIYWLPAVANTAAPTSSEINAGIDLSPNIQAITGFQLTNTPIPTPDLSTVFVTSIPGEDTTAASDLVFYDDDSNSSNAAAIRAAMAKGTAGFVLLAPYGRVTGKRAEVWTVTTTGVNDHWSLGNEAAMFSIPFSQTATPTQSAILP